MKNTDNSQYRKRAAAQVQDTKANTQVKKECCSQQKYKWISEKKDIFAFWPSMLQEEFTDLRMCFVVLIMTNQRVKVALALSLFVRRFCAKSNNIENNPHIIHAPTLCSHIHRLFTAQIFIHLCSCTLQMHKQTTTRAQWMCSFSVYTIALWFPQIDRKGTQIEISQSGQYHWYCSLKKLDLFLSNLFAVLPISLFFLLFSLCLTFMLARTCEFLKIRWNER